MAQKTKLKKKAEEVRVSHVGNHPLLKAGYQNWLDFNFRVQSKPIQNLFLTIPNISIFRFNLMGDLAKPTSLLFLTIFVGHVSRIKA